MPRITLEGFGGGLDGPYVGGSETGCESCAGCLVLAAITYLVVPTLIQGFIYIGIMLAGLYAARHRGPVGATIGLVVFVLFAIPLVAYFLWFFTGIRLS